MKILILTILTVAFFSTTFAQNRVDNSNRADMSEFKKEGELASIRIEPGEPMRIFVIGKEEAKLDLSNMELTVRRLKPYPGRVLTTNRENDYFIVSEPGVLKETTDISVTTKFKNKSETHQFKIKKRLP